MSAAAADFVRALSPPPPSAPRVRKRRRLAARAVALPALFAVACCVCDRMGPIATTRERGLHPPKKSGFRFTIVHALGGWWCGRCLAKRARLLPPATRAGCSDGPRPCRRMLCRYHLAFDLSRKAPDDFELPESCALDVAEKNPDGMTLREVGALLGMTREGSREILVIAVEKLRREGAAGRRLLDSTEDERAMKAPPSAQSVPQREPGDDSDVVFEYPVPSDAELARRQAARFAASLARGNKLLDAIAAESTIDPRVRLSPIEEAMLAALLDCGFNTDSKSSNKRLATLYQQHSVPTRIGVIRPDFALVRHVFDKRFVRIAIEVDGHEFHQLTKEQAERDYGRDRELARAGWIVVRFTGSEVWRDARACALEVAAILIEAVDRIHGEEGRRR